MELLQIISHVLYVSLNVLQFIFLLLDFIWSILTEKKTVTKTLGGEEPYRLLVWVGGEQIGTYSILRLLILCYAYKWFDSGPGNVPLEFQQMMESRHNKIYYFARLFDNFISGSRISKAIYLLHRIFVPKNLNSERKSKFYQQKFPDAEISSANTLWNLCS